MSVEFARRSWSLQRLLLVALGGVGLYAVAAAVAVDLLFVPRVSKLDRDTRQLLGEFEGFADQAARLNRAISTAREELIAGDLQGVRKTVGDARAATPTSLTTTAREAMVDAPLEMRTALALSIERESAIRDVLSRTGAYLDLGRVDQARSSLAQAEALTSQLVSTMAKAQQAGLRDVADRGQALEALARDASRRLFGFSALGIACLLGLVLIFRRRLYLPLVALDAGLRGVSEGDLDTQVEVRRDDEVGRLAALFNRMVVELRERDAEHAIERKEVTRRILDASLDAVITVDPEGRIMSWNPGAEAIFGWTAQEVVGRAFDELVLLPAPEERRRGALRGAFAGAESEPSLRRREIPARRKDGSTFTAEISAVRLVEEGRTVALAGFIRDVTERRRAEEALRRSERLLRSVLDNSPVMIYMKDLEGRYTLVNRRWLEVFGLESADVIGRRDVDVLPESLVGDVHVGDRAALESRQTTQIESRVDLPGGPRELVESRFPLLDSSGAPYALCGVVSDVTEILELQDQVRRAQRLEAVGRLAGGIAHDFNNLVAVILGQTQLALEEAEGDEVREGLEEVERAAQRAAALTSQLLAFARKQIVSTRVEEVNDLVQDTLSMLSRVIESNVVLDAELHPEAGRVDVDPSQFSQVLLNVLVNAREAMGPEGGHVAIRTVPWTVARPEPSLELSPGPYVRITVEDEGPGIPERVMNRIFEPFFSTKDQGTGLGLATCHGIVKQAGGDISVRNRPGSGAEVAIYLPRIEAVAS